MLPTHKRCYNYNTKVNYWLRSQFPIHTKGFISDFQILQIKLLASYHGLYDESDLAQAWPQIHEVYGRATLPIAKGRMALRSLKLVFLRAFACSLAVSLKHLAIDFPDWIKLDRDSNLLNIASDRSPGTSYQVEQRIKECQTAYPEGSFGNDDDASAILNTIANVEVGVVANQRAAQLQSETHKKQLLVSMTKLRSKEEGRLRKAPFMTS